MKNIKNIILMLLVMVPFNVFAEYEHFKLWDMSDGLSNNTVKSIAQDKLGFIWLGTFDGLCKFDGVDFICVNGLYRLAREKISLKALKI